MTLVCSKALGSRVWGDIQGSERWLLRPGTMPGERGMVSVCCGDITVVPGCPGPHARQAWDDRFRRRAQPQPVSVRVRLTVDFLDAVRGVKKTVQVPGLGDAGGSKRLEVDIPAGGCCYHVSARRLLLYEAVCRRRQYDPQVIAARGFAAACV